MDQSLIADGILDLKQGNASSMFLKTDTNQNQKIAVYDQDILDAVESALLRGCNTRSQVLKAVPNLHSLENAEAYINRVQWEFHQTSDGVDKDSERIKMTKVLWDVIKESYEALEKEKRKSDEEFKAGAVASILKNIIAAEQRISTLLGLNAPQQVDMRLVGLIAELGPDAIQHYKDLKQQAAVIAEEILNP